MTTFNVISCPYCGGKYIDLPDGLGTVLSCKYCGKQFSKESSLWKPGDTIMGLYEVKSLLGEGGFGAVYRVHHKEWGIDLAVKKPKDSLLKAVGKIEIFEREAETWVNLGLHPHIVHCHYIRRLPEENGIPHIFTEYINGGNLENWIKQRRLYTSNVGNLENTLVHILDFAIQIAWGLHHAHENGLVHQDIKPANIMLTENDIIKVADFGLAHIQNGNKEISVKNLGMTVAYASPEQIQGNLLTYSADLWSWAVTVLEMLIGERTWQAGSVAPEILAQYKRNAAQQGSQLIKIPKQLYDLLQWCLHENPEERPKTLAEVAQILAEDIYPAVAGVQYPKKLPKKNQETSSNLNNRAISLLDFGQQQKAEEIWQKALKAQPYHLESIYNYGLILWRTARLTDAELIERIEEARQFYPGKWLYRYLLASIHLERGEIDLALAMLKSVTATIKEQNPQIEHHEISTTLEEAKRYLRASQAITITYQGEICAPKETHEPIAFTKSRKTAVTARKLLDDCFLFKIWNVKQSNCTNIFKGYHKQMSMLALSEDVRYLATGNKEGTLKLWVTQNGRCLHTFNYSKGIHAIEFSPDGQYLLIKTAEGTLHHRKLVATIYPYTARYCFSQVQTSEIVFAVQNKYAHYLKEAHIAIANRDAKRAASLIRWARAQPEHNREPEAVDIWRQLYSRLPRNKLRSLWMVSAWSGHTQAVTACALCIKTPFAYSAGLDGKIKLWEINSTKHIQNLQEESKPITHLTLSHNDHRLLYLLEETKQQQNILKMVTIGKRHRPKEYKTSGRVTAIALDESGQYALLGYLEGDLELWEIQRGIRLRTFVGDLQDPQTGEWLKAVDKHTCQISAITFVPGNRHILSADQYGVLKYWEIATGHCLFSVNEHYNPIFALSASADGRFALSGSADRTLKIWQLGKKGHCYKTLIGHEDAVTVVTYSKDGQYVLSGSQDKTIKLWNVRKGHCIYTLKHRTVVKTISLSADNSHILAGYRCGTLKLWFLDWELTDKEQTLWDEGAEPFIDLFYNKHIPYQHPLPKNRMPTPTEINHALKPNTNALAHWTENDFKDLLHTLGCGGYGWLKSEGVKEKLAEKKEQHRKTIWQTRWQTTYNLLHLPLLATFIIFGIGEIFSTLSTLKLVITTLFFFLLFIFTLHFLEKEYTLLPINKGIIRRPLFWLFLTAVFIIIS